MNFVVIDDDVMLLRGTGGNLVIGLALHTLPVFLSLHRHPLCIL